MKVLFYLPNGGSAKVDYSNPYGLNPGIGGTQYMIWMISCMLSREYSDLDIVLAADAIEYLPEWMNCVKAESAIEALKTAENMKADIFVCRGPYMDEPLMNALKKTELKVIIWNHNYENNRDLNYMSECKSIKRCVCVSREQYERLCDHKAYAKSTYIYNALPLDNYSKHKREEYNEKAVCFLGSLHKEKGFLQLARSFPEMEKAVDGIQLYVIGSGKLYNSGNKLGKYGLAAEKYEKKFIKYLVDKEGNIKDNVHFMGVVGSEDKLKIMNKCAVGIANPLGADETFCIAAVEFEALGVPVIARKKYAFYDTVGDETTGLLHNTYSGMVKNIARLINDKNLNEEFGKNGSEFSKQFDSAIILKQWYKLLNDVYYDTEQKSESELHNLLNNKKYLRAANRKLKKVLPFMPSILWYEDIPDRIKGIIRRVIKWMR